MRSPALDAAISAATHGTGRAPVTTGQLLAAMVADTDSQAGRALATLGVSAEAVGAALAQVPIAGTSDETPPARSIAVTIGGTTALISDPEVAATLQGLNANQLAELIRKATGPEIPGQAAG